MPGKSMAWVVDGQCSLFKVKGIEGLPFCTRVKTVARWYAS
jgi:hypothetical protein